MARASKEPKSRASVHMWWMLARIWIGFVMQMDLGLAYSGRMLTENIAFVSRGGS